jgi:hypothetical protein
MENGVEKKTLNKHVSKKTPFHAFLLNGMGKNIMGLCSHPT